MSKSFEFLSTVAKADPVLRQLHGTVYVADKLDSQNEYTTLAELTKAAHAALRDGVQVDVDHSGKPLAKQHAAVVESAVKDGVWSAVVQLSKEAWAQLVDTGKVGAFSMGGVAGRRAGTLLGKSASEMFDIKARFISLVARGANGAAVVAKADEAPQWARELLASNAALAAEIAELKAGDVKKSSGSPSTAAELRKAERDARAVELRKSHAVLSDQLERLWSAEGASLFDPGHRRAKEAELCVEIDRVERELATLNKSGIDFDAAGRSAFATRGGVSERIRLDKIFPAGDSAFERPAEALSKREDGLPIDTLLL